MTSGNGGGDEQYDTTSRALSQARASKARVGRRGGAVSLASVGSGHYTRWAFPNPPKHQDSTWPNSVDTIRSFASLLDDDELVKVVHDNASRLLRLTE